MPSVTAQPKKTCFKAIILVKKYQECYICIGNIQKTRCLIQHKVLLYTKKQVITNEQSK